MRQPKQRGVVIDSKRRKNWLSSFGQYPNVSQASIDEWLDQFKPADRDIAARVLDCIEFFGHTQINGAFRDILSSLPGWDVNPKKRKGKWRFVPYTMSAGQSGDSMVHKFRRANQLSGEHNAELFIYKSQLLLENLGPDDTVVFIDDFAGTGDQACSIWDKGAIQELLPGNPRVLLVLVAGRQSARKEIEKKTKLEVHIGKEFGPGDDVFSSHSKHFDSKERDRLMSYCRLASRKHPAGYGDCGLVVVFLHDCPNNSIAVLHADSARWTPLFSRYGHE